MACPLYLRICVFLLVFRGGGGGKIAARARVQEHTGQTAMPPEKKEQSACHSKAIAILKVREGAEPSRKRQLQLCSFSSDPSLPRTYHVIVVNVAKALVRVDGRENGANVRVDLVFVVAWGLDNDKVSRKAWHPSQAHCLERRKRHLNQNKTYRSEML